MTDTTTLIKVAQAWSSKDDWGLDTILMSTLRDIERALQAGDDPTALMKHGRHVFNTCVLAGCMESIPFTVKADHGLFLRLVQAGEAKELARETRSRDLRAHEGTLDT